MFDYNNDIVEISDNDIKENHKPFPLQKIYGWLCVHNRWGDFLPFFPPPNFKDIYEKQNRQEYIRFTWCKTSRGSSNGRELCIT